LSQPIKSRYNQKRTITQISDSEYLIEGESDYGRLGFEIDPSMLTYVDFEGGPFLHIGDNFWGKGKIMEIQTIDSGRDGYMIIKITLNSNKETKNDRGTNAGDRFISSIVN
jgi:hypothetical protein